MAKIVVLEDDAATRRLVCAVLKKSGHEVIDVDNGAEGLLIVLAEQPDLVVSDVEMPKLNGFEVLQNIRQDEFTTSTPVILLTSLTSKADIRQGIRDGANDYITKPFEPADLLRSVETLLVKPHAQLYETPESDSGFVPTQSGGLELMPMDQARDADDAALRTIPAALLPADGLTLPEPAQSLGRSLGNAWALNLQVMNAQAVQQRLSAQAWRFLLRQLLTPMSKDAAMRSADYLDMNSNGVTLYFLCTEADGSALPSHKSARRATLALEAMVQTGAQCREWAVAQWPELADRPPRIVVSLHHGPIWVQRMPLEYGGERDAVLGDTAQLIARLRAGDPPLAWRVLGTAAAVQAAPGVYRLGAQMEVSVGSQEVQVHALMGCRDDLRIEGAAPPTAWI
jgi:CheY-like chemotaxis protein